MKAETIDLAALFGKPVHYIVPLYQRPYVWTRNDQWEPLWEDVRGVADRQLDESPANDEIPHFLGAVVLEQALMQVGKIEARSIIDGQQRLTTLQLLIAAARSVAIEHGLENARRSFEDLLYNQSHLVKDKGGEFKVFPTERDRAAFAEAVGDGVAALTGGHLLHEAYRYFRAAVREWVNDGSDGSSAEMRVDALSTGIWKRLVIVAIDLDRGDNAQVIFETLNARGTPLLAGDLIKNHLFQAATLQGDDVAALWERYWKDLDTDWWREPVQQGRLKRPRLDIFLNHWLAMATGAEVVSGQLFAGFKRYLAAGDKRAADVLADLARYGKVYETFESEPIGTELGRFLYRLNVMEVTTAYPARLWLLGPDGLDDLEQRRVALGAIESWLVRRMLARQTTKNYNTVFLALLKSVREEATRRHGSPLGSDVVDYLAGLRGESQAWPRAGTVRAAFRSLPAYQVFPRSRLRMVLESLEYGMHTGMNESVVLPTDLTVEHVLPQEWHANWPLPDGIDPFQARLDRDAAKQRIGNLTLVTGKLNPSMSNAGWPAKREALQEHSVMLIATDIRAAETWDEQAIAARGERLATLATHVWPRPNDGEDEGDEPVEFVGSDHTAGPPDPENAAAFASVLGVADEAGVGTELRRIIEVSRELRLYPRPDRYSVMVAPPGDRRVGLFAVWPQANEGGSFRIWKKPSNVVRWIPGATAVRVAAVLGTDEETGLLDGVDTEDFLGAFRNLIPHHWLTGSFDERHAQLLELGIPGLDRVPRAVLKTIDQRAGGDPAVALRFAVVALERDEVFIRPQQSKDDPWYYQVRHPKFGQVVAYAHPGPGRIRIEFLLPGSNATYGVAESRGGPYGIVLIATDDDGLRVAGQLLDDALGSRLG